MNRNLKPLDNNNVNGLIGNDYIELQDEYQKILNKTLMNSKNKVITDLIRPMRNKLIHQSLQLSKFLITNLPPENDTPKTVAFFVCDFEHLVVLIEWEQKFNLLSDYFLDHHLRDLSCAYCRPSSKRFQELKNRVKVVAPHLYQQICSLNLESLDIDNASQEFIRSFKEWSEVTYSELENNFTYRLFSYMEYLVAKNNDKNIKPKNMYFNIEKYIREIYDLYFDYFTKLHDLISNFLSPDIEEFLSLQVSFGAEQEEIIASRRRISYKLPLCG